MRDNGRVQSTCGHSRASGGTGLELWSERQSPDMDPNSAPTNHHHEVSASRSDVDSPEGRRTPAPLGRRALLSAAGLAGAFALTRFVPAREASAHARPDPSTMIPGAAARSLVPSALESRIDGLERKVASTPEGICESRIPITALPSSRNAQFVISSPGAYYLPGNLIQKSRKVCIDIRATCNHVGALPGITPYTMGGSVHGPVARVSSGDISFSRTASHHLVNTAT